MPSVNSIGLDRQSPIHPRQAGLGFIFFVLLLFPVIDYARLPGLVSLSSLVAGMLFLWWFLHPNKRWNFQIGGFLVFLTAMAIGVVVATNTYWAFWTTYGMAAALLCVCIPLIHIIDSWRKLTIFINVLICVFCYMGVWAIFHAGYGPGGREAAQDENYVALVMDIGIPLAYFSMSVAENKLSKLFCLGSLMVFCITVVVSSSRGGFLGMAAVFSYIFVVSPKKGQMLMVLGLAGLLIVAIAGPTYWEEMSTITDTTEATADLRLEYWSIAWRMFLGNIPVGVGPANYKWRMGEYQSPEQITKFGHFLTGAVVVHSMYFEMLSEVGLLGFGAVLAILYRSFRELISFMFISEARTTSNEVNGRNDVPLESAEASVIRERRLIRFYSRALAGSLIGALVPAAFVSLAYFSYVWILSATAVAFKYIAEETLAQHDNTTPDDGQVSCKK